MTKNILVIAVLGTLFLNSCKETPKQENPEMTTSETVEKDDDDFITATSTDKDGKQLDMLFNNTEGTLTVNFNGETIELVQERAASGIWYINEDYELRGKGNDIEFRKNGIVIFEHKDDIVQSSLKDKEGRTLDMTFNNTEGTVKAYLNGGEQIDLVAEKAASGIWYKNEQYELRGKGEKLELTKDGKTVFKN